MGDIQVTWEIKPSKRVHEGDLRNLCILKEEQKVARSITISFEQEPKNLERIEYLYWETFLQVLWNGDVV